jgi:hypothetical protein
MEKIHNTTADKILKLLLSNRKDEFTIRAISKKVSVDYKTVYLAVKEMAKSNALSTRKAGQTTLCSISQKGFNAGVFRAELIRRNELLSKNKDIYSLYGYFEDIKEPFFILLLFGSYASGKFRKGSDIDIMFIADDEKLAKNVQKTISLIPLNIHFIEFNSKEFISMLKTTDFNVGKEAAANNIILFGIEDYYRLLKNA